jgi:DNA repair protein RecO (recombination protein O)
MPLTDTSGIVLRTSDWSETSLIVTWFTRDFGKLRTVAKGAHRPKSAFRGKLDLFYLDDLVFVPSRRGELHTLAECYVENPFPRIRERLDAFNAACYCCELVDISTEPEGPVPPLFQLLTESLAALDAAPPSPLFIARFELLALDALGFRPDVDRLPLDAGTRRIMSDLLDDAPGLSRLRLTTAQHRQMDAFLLNAIGQQFGRLPKSRRLLNAPSRKSA